VRPCAQEYESEVYAVEFYSKAMSIGLRKRVTKESVFFFGNKSKDEKSLRAVADDAMKKLDEGEAANSVHEWCKEQVR
jgi:hypothetical protein